MNETERNRDQDIAGEEDYLPQVWEGHAEGVKEMSALRDDGG